MKRVLDIYRLTTSRFRSLPDFIIIGAMKSGTSSLFAYLAQHPQVRTISDKEIHFFDFEFSKGELWYRSHFPLSRSYITGEASPYYLCHPHAPRRIHNLLPSVKLIAILRNPTNRAISHYFHAVRMGFETLPIMEALQAEEDRLRPEWDRMLKNESYNSRCYPWFSYKQRGIYIDQLERYWQYCDKDNLLCLNADRFFSETRNVLKHVFEFIGVESDFEPIDLSPRAVGSNRAEVPSSVHEYLDDFFSLHNQKLYKCLGQNLGW